ncbi:MAG: hypothetical protein JWP89_1647, partial [Schlesneria sp.]|nr:hypothetical protein [Schlesneria sp.]
MNHADFANSVDRFLDGNLDFVEAAEFDLHSRDCKEGCVKKWT